MLFDDLLSEILLNFDLGWGTNHNYLWGFVIFIIKKTMQT